MVFYNFDIADSMRYQRNFHKRQIFGSCKEPPFSLYNPLGEWLILCRLSEVSLKANLQLSLKRLSLISVQLTIDFGKNLFT